jgi:hypothetical protein
VTQIHHRKDPFFNVNPLRPRLNLRDVRQNNNYSTLSEGFQKATHSETASQAKEVKIPIVGYRGHRVGYKAQNFYGKNFRDCAIQSKMVQRMME